MGHGAKAKFSCRDGYTLVGNRYIECRFGNWSGETPKCEEGTVYFTKPYELFLILKSRLFGIFQFIALFLDILSTVKFCWLEAWVFMIIDLMSAR